MSWGYYGFRRYVPVAERRAKAERELAKLQKKSGKSTQPVILEGRTIARTFWGKAWCDNLEAYSDYGNRLPRGRTYVRNGSVVDLQIEAGKVTARVSGSELYRIEIAIKPLATTIWNAVQKECAGKIDSLLELLQGKLSSAVMEVVTRRDRGLFPSPREIKLECSCPDWAGLCKHLAAVLYGVGARLDLKPELLFLLRGVDPANLISQASAAEAVRQVTPAEAPALGESELAEVFGIELEATAVPVALPSSARTQRPKPFAEQSSPRISPKKRKVAAKSRRRATRSAAKPSVTTPARAISNALSPATIHPSASTEAPTVSAP